MANSVLCLKEAVDAYPTIKMYKPGEQLYCNAMHFQIQLLNVQFLDNSAEEYVFARSGSRMKRFLVDELIGKF